MQKVNTFQLRDTSDPKSLISDIRSRHPRITFGLHLLPPPENYNRRHLPLPLSTVWVLGLGLGPGTGKRQHAAAMRPAHHRYRGNLDVI